MAKKGSFNAREPFAKEKKESEMKIPFQKPLFNCGPYYFDLVLLVSFTNLPNPHTINFC